MGDFARLNVLSERIIGLAIEVHRHLGPGMLESTYQRCLCFELEKHGLQFDTEVEVPLTYKELEIERAYRADLIVDKCVVVEIKSVETILPVHEAQLLTYLRLCKMKLGLLLNFNVPLLKNGIIRKIN
jgi:GxxExxY protein